MSFLGGVGTASPPHNTFTGPMSFLGVPQSQVGGTLIPGRYPPARTGWGTLWPGQDGVTAQPERMGYPLARTGWEPLGQDRDGVHSLLVKTGWGTLGQDRDGVPLPIRTAQHALAMRRAVCLLRSRRRTFLCNLESSWILAFASKLLLEPFYVMFETWPFSTLILVESKTVVWSLEQLIIVNNPVLSLVKIEQLHLISQQSIAFESFARDSLLKFLSEGEN